MRELFEGVSLAAFARGNSRLLAPLKARHADAKTSHAEALAALKERRAKAQEIKDPEERAAALEALKGERPTHPGLVAIGTAVAGGVVLWPVLHGWHTVTITGGATVWTLAALVAGQKPAAQPTGEDQAEEVPAVVGPTPGEVHSIVADLTASGTSVLLSRIARQLTAQHPHQKWSTGDVRPLLAAAGIAVRPGVRTPDGNGPGVHHTDVPAAPPAPEAPLVGVVGAGQAANANANNGLPWVSGEGFVLKADPGNPARTVVVGHISDAA